VIKLTGDKRYPDDEIAIKDNFFHPYIGKIYAKGETEIMSMGLEFMSTDPKGFAKADPDYFKFIFNTLKGK
jgi:hypothetical protein